MRGIVSFRKLRKLEAFAPLRPAFYAQRCRLATQKMLVIHTSRLTQTTEGIGDSVNRGINFFIGGKL